MYSSYVWYIQYAKCYFRNSIVTISNLKIACPFEELKIGIMEFLKKDLLILND